MDDAQLARQATPDPADVVAMMRIRSHGPATTHATGIEPLDAEISRLCGPGRMHVYAGPPGSGKSSIAQAIVRTCLHAGEHVAVCAYDRDPYDWARRLAALDGETGTDPDIGDYLAREYPNLVIRTSQLEDIAARLPAPGGVLVLDSIQTARVGERPRGPDETHYIDAVVRVLEGEQQVNRRWVIATSEVAIGRRKGMYAPKGSTSIPHAADVLVTLSPKGRFDALRIDATIEKPTTGRTVTLHMQAGVFVPKGRETHDLVRTTEHQTGKPPRTKRPPTKAKGPYPSKVPDDEAMRRVEQLRRTEPALAARHIGPRCQIGRERGIAIARKLGWMSSP